MIPAKDLIDTFYIPLNEHGGYIWGSYGQTWTQKKQDSATRPMTVKYGQKWVGHRVWDCSGMFYWAYKQFGESIYHGSNTIWKKYCSSKGELKNGARADGQPIKPGTAVFLYRKSDNCRHHIGLYIGGGECIEAKGTINGVVKSKLSHWDEWGELSAVDYSGVEGDHIMQILRKGAKGEAVKALQEMLAQCGYGYIVGAPDGVYGAKTETAVKAFQTDNGLDPDGVVGPRTQELLAMKCAAPTKEELPEDDDEYEAPSNVISLTYTEAANIREALQKALAVIEEAME